MQTVRQWRVRLGLLMTMPSRREKIIRQHTILVIGDRWPRLEGASQIRALGFPFAMWLLRRTKLNPTGLDSTHARCTSALELSSGGVEVPWGCIMSDDELKMS
jgi:hypothetical protein